MSARISARSHEFEVRVERGWMSIHVQHHVALAMVELFRDSIRAMSWREGEASLRTAATHARMALSILTTDSIQNMSYEDVSAILCIRGIRASELGEHIQHRAIEVTLRHSSMNDPVVADRTAKAAESIVVDVINT